VTKDVSAVVLQGGHGNVACSLINALPHLIPPKGCDQAGSAARIEEGRRDPIASNGPGSGNRPGIQPADCGTAIQNGGPSPRRAIKAGTDRSSLVEEIAAAVRAARQHLRNNCLTPSPKQRRHDMLGYSSPRRWPVRLDAEWSGSYDHRANVSVLPPIRHRHVSRMKHALLGIERNGYK